MFKYVKLKSEIKKLEDRLKGNIYLISDLRTDKDKLERNCNTLKEEARHAVAYADKCAVEHVEDSYTIKSLNNQITLFKDLSDIYKKELMDLKEMVASKQGS